MIDPQQTALASRKTENGMVDVFVMFQKKMYPGLHVASPTVLDEYFPVLLHSQMV